MKSATKPYKNSVALLSPRCFSVLVASILSIAVGATDLVACSCPVFSPGPKLVQEHFRQYEVIFIGKVIERSSQYSTFQIIRRMKGLAGKTTITAGHFDSCSTLYDSGYHIIYGNLVDTLLNTSYCSCNESLQIENYQIAGAHDAASFESLLRHGIEQYNFHVYYLKDILDQAPKQHALFTLPITKDWYRSYTIYHSIRLVLIGLLISVFFFYLNYRLGSRKAWLPVIAIALSVGILVTLLSTLVYGETRPIGIPEEFIVEMYGFPKYIWSRTYEIETGTYAGRNFYLINFIGNTGVYAVICAVVIQLFYLIRTLIVKKLDSENGGLRE